MPRSFQITMPRILLAISIAVIALGLTMSHKLSAIPYGVGLYDTCTYDTCSISITTSGTVNLTASPTESGVSSTAKDEVTVETGSSTGYTLTLLDSDTNTDLASADDSIPASSGTQASPVTLTTNTWGYRVDGLSGFGAGPTSAQTSDSNSLYSFAGVPASDQTPHTIKTTADAAVPAEVTDIWFGISIDTAKPSGVYSGQVTYTAVTNE